MTEQFNEQILKVIKKDYFLFIFIGMNKIMK